MYVLIILKDLNSHVFRFISFYCKVLSVIPVLAFCDSFTKLCIYLVFNSNNSLSTGLASVTRSQAESHIHQRQYQQYENTNCCLHFFFLFLNCQKAHSREREKGHGHAHMYPVYFSSCQNWGLNHGHPWYLCRILLHQHQTGACSIFSSSAILFYFFNEQPLWLSLQMQSSPFILLFAVIGDITRTYQKQPYWHFFSESVFI